MLELWQHNPIVLLHRISVDKMSTYYYVHFHMDEDKDVELKRLIIDISNDNKERHGYKRITPELETESLYSKKAK